MSYVTVFSKRTVYVVAREAAELYLTTGDVI